MAALIPALQVHLGDLPSAMHELGRFIDLAGQRGKQAACRDQGAVDECSLMVCSNGARILFEKDLREQMGHY